MIHFPVFEQLEIKNYGLYPGTSGHPGVDIHFKPGLTLILGANGLGKTTLVTILYRMLAGAYDLPQTTLEATELGGASLDIKPLDANDRALFANRVKDLAINATAVLKLSIGPKRLTIKRTLKDISLIAAHFDDGEAVTNEVDEYQKLLPSLSGVSTFGDWLLLLRHMVFYFEDRRELVWDTSAQRHIFRMMFLPPAEAADWYRQERSILRLDSRYRNDTASLNRLKKRVASSDRAVGDEASLRAELNSLTSLQEQDSAALSALVADADSLDTRRHMLRQNLLVAELEADKHARALECEKLSLLKNYFPTEQQTAQHLYSLLIAHRHCAVCGNDAPSAAEELSTRVANLKCVICGSHLTPDSTNVKVISFSKEKVRSLYEELEEDRARASALKAELSDSSRSYDAVASRIIDTRAAVAEREKQINRIERALPHENDDRQARARSELSALSEALAGDKAELIRLTTSFKELIEQANTKILQHASAIKKAFAEFASGFLSEDAQLKWSPVHEALGQLGLAKVAFPAFDLAMSGSNFTAPTTRRGPEAVSESQREFIDLAFRMALIQVAGEGTGGSLVIDAPESSLDAFFVKRAATVLCRFGKSDTNNRLVVASNLVDGQLLPEMIKGGIPPEEATYRLINLLKIAVPTAALRDNRSEYEEELQKLLALGGIRE